MSSSHSVALSRSDVPYVVDTLSSREKRGQETWRIAEVLDLLLDAGQFKLALDLADDITCRLEGSETERLFVAYKHFCELMVSGVVGDTLDELHRIHSIIEHGGHSSADKTRATLLLGRALSFCINVGALSGESVVRARDALIDRLSETSDAQESASLFIELAKSYLLDRKPEFIAAKGVVTEFECSAVHFGLSDDVQFDVACLEYTLKASMQGIDSASELSFRNQFSDASPVIRALQELSVQKLRLEQDADLDALQKCAEVLESQSFLGGAFEAYSSLAKILVSRGLNVHALRMAKRALRTAERAGFMYGEVGAKLLLFEIYQLGGEDREWKAVASSLREQHLSELIVMGYGISIATIQTSTASGESLRRYARQVDTMLTVDMPKFCRMSILSIVARTYFQAGDFNQAQKAWEELAKSECGEGLLLDSYGAELLSVRCRLESILESSADVASELHAIEVELTKLTSQFHNFAPTPKAKLGLARTHILLAQLEGFRGAPLLALKHLSVARELSEQLGSVAELAAVECATGAFLLEIGAHVDPSILESAILSLRRADEFYRRTGRLKARLKVLYFLSSSAHLLSQLQSSRLGSLRWKRLAMKWIVECEAVRRKTARRGMPRLDCDCFDPSPPVSVSAIRSFKKYLTANGRKLFARNGGNGESRRFAGELLH